MNSREENARVAKRREICLPRGAEVPRMWVMRTVAAAAAAVEVVDANCLGCLFAVVVVVVLSYVEVG